MIPRSAASRPVAGSAGTDSLRARVRNPWPRGIRARLAQRRTWPQRHCSLLPIRQSMLLLRNPPTKAERWFSSLVELTLAGRCASEP
jgi:hypothetical protein